MLVHDQYIYPEKPDCDDDIVVFHSGFSSTMANYSHGKDTRDYYPLGYPGPRDLPDGDSEVQS